jgi:hypothetical protein
MCFFYIVIMSLIIIISWIECRQNYVYCIAHTKELIGVKKAGAIVATIRAVFYKNAVMDHKPGTRN